jgi:hypothetical protein
MLGGNAKFDALTALRRSGETFFPPRVRHFDHCAVSRLLQIKRRTTFIVASESFGYFSDRDRDRAAAL